MENGLKGIAEKHEIIRRKVNNEKIITVLVNMSIWDRKRQYHLEYSKRGKYELAFTME